MGEGLAHKEVTRKHGVRFECVSGSCRKPPTFAGCHKHHNWAPLFVVVAVGSNELDTGWRLSHEDERAWLYSDKACMKM